jgi:hypothetical protein
MKKYVWLIFGISILLSNSGFAQQMKNAADPIKPFLQPEAGFARIYVVRPTDLFLFEKFYIYADMITGKNRVGYTKGMEYISFSVLPGKHKIISEGKNRKSIIVEVNEGGTIFIKQNPTRGGVGVNQDSLELLTEDEGKYFVNMTRPGTIDIEKISSRFNP